MTSRTPTYQRQRHLFQQQKGGCVRQVEGADVPEPHFKRPQARDHKRRCKKCKKSEHYSSTCGRNPAPQKRPRGRPVGSGSGRGRGRGGRSTKSFEYSGDGEDDIVSEMEGDEMDDMEGFNPKDEISTNDIVQ